jgi:hypothetical protein
VVVRRRRLTTPPVTGPGAKLDPNRIAEYIDSVLPPEQLAEVEAVCLESDLHLAEIAACHQILTVVLSKPALVPPTARQRMYGLVRGREAIPYRKAAAVPDTEFSEIAAPAEASDADETLLLGLPLYRNRGRWFWRLVPPVVVLLLVGALALALWQAMPSQSARVPEPRVAQGNGHGRQEAASSPAEDAKKTEQLKPEAAPPVAKANAQGTQPAPADGGDNAPPKPIQPKTPPDGSSQAEATPSTAPPSKVQKVAGRYVSGMVPSVLLQRGGDQEPWQRVVRDTPITTAERLVSLPGYRSELRLNSGLQLVLWGDLPDPSSPVIMLESAVVLHANPGMDLDLTLERGRIDILNYKPEGAARVRVRFYDEVWDLTLLDPGTEVAMEIGGWPDVGFSKEPGKGEAPRADLGLFVLQGQADLKIRYDTHRMHEPRGPSLFIWNNVRGARGPLTLNPQQLPAWARKAPPEGKDAQARRDALDKLATRLNPGTNVDLVLQETLKEEDPSSRVVAVYGFAATDDLPNLLDALADEKNLEARTNAIVALRHWIGLSAENDHKLYEALENKYKAGPAAIIMDLLHPLSARQKAEPETYETLIAYLKHDKLPIRQLAYIHLIALVPQGLKIPFDPAGTTEQRDYTYDKWKELIPSGKLPPKPTPPDAPEPGNKGKKGDRES